MKNMGFTTILSENLERRRSERKVEIRIAEFLPTTSIRPSENLDKVKKGTNGVDSQILRFKNHSRR
jgi:hypothetical protein